MFTGFQMYANVKHEQYEDTNDHSHLPFCIGPTHPSGPLRDRTARGRQASGKHKVTTDLNFKPAPNSPTRESESRSENWNGTQPQFLWD